MEFLKVAERQINYDVAMKSSEAIAKYMSDVAVMDREAMWVLHLDSRLRVTKREMVCLGTLNCASIYPREVFRGAIINSTSAIILVHNHPTGEPQPSPSDMSITKVMRDAGSLLCIDILDHIIISSSQRFYSLADNKQM